MQIAVGLGMSVLAVGGCESLLDSGALTEGTQDASTASTDSGNSSESGSGSGSGSGTDSGSSSGSGSGSGNGTDSGSGSGSDSGSSGSDSDASSGSSSGGMEAGACAVDGGCYVVPSGWSLVAFAGNQTVTCPAQSTQTDVYEAPNASTACTCGSIVAAAPTCAAGPITVKYDQTHLTPTCNLSPTPATMADTSSCNTDLDTGLLYPTVDISYSPPGPSGGQCTPVPVPLVGNVTYAAQDRICTPDSEPCANGDCKPSFGAGLQVCIAASGSVACPGVPFTEQHIVGGAATFTCSATCTCHLNVGTCAGTVTLYSNNNCTGSTLAVPANGSCQNESAAGNLTYASYSYAATALTYSSMAGGTSTAQNVTQPGLQTLCCSP